ncbi:MAG TPA: DUF5069 domain-containing protein [Candidatus Elarobacter sp.]|jgi:hypothetical protein|nr:DUF5069 domain-containing protein [Candidatus Elarobacter sp.]
MEPLDLESRPPRSPREQMLGLYFLPRTIDKIRAELPGGKPGEYIVTGPNSMSAYVLYKLKIDVEELRAVVARAADEAAIEAWLRERIDPAVVDGINAKLIGSRVDAASPENLALLHAKHPWLASRPDIVGAFEMLDTDDQYAFAKR